MQEGWAQYLVWVTMPVRAVASHGDSHMQSLLSPDQFYNEDRRMRGTYTVRVPPRAQRTSPAWSHTTHTLAVPGDTLVSPQQRSSISPPP
jgi:hypothetical protein